MVHEENPVYGGGPLDASGGSMGLLQRLRERLTATHAPSQPILSHGRPADSESLAAPRYAVIDVETTGLSASSHRILEIAVVTTDPGGRVLDAWHTRLNPQGPVGATHIHGITEKDVASAPLFSDVVADLNPRLAGAALVAHNARFDMAFLRAEYARAQWRMPFAPVLCTLEASTHHLPALPRRRLVDVCGAVGLPPHAAHSALGDATATASVLAHFLHPDRPPRPVDLDLPVRAHSVPWPTTPESTPVAIGADRASPRSRRLSAQAERNIVAASSRTPVKPLTQLLDRFSLADAVDEGAPPGSVAYLEKLAEALEDGVLDPNEAVALHDVAESFEMSPHDVQRAHLSFVRALAREALADGKVSRDERTELTNVAEALSVPKSAARASLVEAAEFQNAAKSNHLPSLPQGWEHGEPLRVGDRVVFTGCEPLMRAELERRSEASGVRVMNGVARTTAMLVTDGSMAGGKARKAAELGTRVVDPETYGVLLDHLQPPAPNDAGATRAEPAEAAPGGADEGHPQAASSVVQNDAGEAAEQPTAAQLRAWGRANGWQLGERGRLPAELRAAYLASENRPDSAAE